MYQAISVGDANESNFKKIVFGGSCMQASWNPKISSEKILIAKKLVLAI